MPSSPSHYVLGTKYGVPARDMLPAMLSGSVIGIGFAHDRSLPQLVGLNYDEALAELRRLLPHERPDARTQLARFFAIRPGDLVALKASGSPVRKHPRLIIARYAVVAGNQQVKYVHAEPLGHTIAVELLDEMEPIELTLGYGRTLHHIIETGRVKAIFGMYAEAANVLELDLQTLKLKSTHTSKVASRGEYLLQRVHNELQNTLYKFLRERYGNAAQLEANGIDISVEMPDAMLIVEVKSSPSPTYCVREALGQMLHYAFRGGYIRRVKFLVVGPAEESKVDADFVSQICNVTSLSLAYNTVDGYIAAATRGEA